MNTILDSADKIFTILNGNSGVTSLLDGEVYRGEPMSESVYQYRNITVAPLSTSNGFINEHVININCYAPDLFDGQPDELQLNPIAKAVITALEGFSASDELCELEIISNNLIRDENNRSYINIRVELSTE